MKGNIFIGLKPKFNKKCDLFACHNIPNFILVYDLSENFTKMILHSKKKSITMMIFSMYPIDKQVENYGEVE